MREVLKEFDKKIRIDKKLACVLRYWKWGPVTDDLEIPDIPDHNDGPHGLKAGVEKTFYIIIE